MIIVGIGHRARNGKDTVAEYLSKAYGWVVLHLADALYEECRRSTICYRESSQGLRQLFIDGMVFNSHAEEPQDRLRALFEQASSWIKGRLYYPQEQGIEGPTAWKSWLWPGMIQKDGELLQWYGTQFRRAFFGEDYWIRQLHRRLDALPQDVPGVVIPDVRFRNEVAYLRALGQSGSPHALQRGTPQVVLWKVERPEAPLDRDAQHESEMDLEGYGEWDAVISNDGSLDQLYERVEAQYQSLVGSL
jgi:hypothetical protein